MSVIVSRREYTSLENVVIAFSNAGYEVSEIYPVDQYPGPLTNRARPIQSGGKFYLKLGEVNIELYVVTYSKIIDAIYINREINALNRRMNDGFAYSFRKDKAVFLINTLERDTAAELSAVFFKMHN